jgi:hypothetical protein
MQPIVFSTLVNKYGFRPPRHVLSIIGDLEGLKLLHIDPLPDSRFYQRDICVLEALEA